jgi:FkbM family methyltransferase
LPEQQPSFDLFNLKGAIACNASTVTGADPVRITMSPQQWAYAAIVPLNEGSEQALKGAARLIIRIDATIREGRMGIGIAQADLREFVAEEKQSTIAERTSLTVMVDSPPPGIQLVIRNTAPDGVVTTAEIHGISTELLFKTLPREGGDGGVEVWLDVGAHLGEKTFHIAAGRPDLRVYAFEPNLEVASKLMGRLANYVVLPMAVAETDGSADFYLNAFTGASSLLPFNPLGFETWIGREALRTEKKICVPTIRLETFLNRMGIGDVSYLKIDAQGADLAVVRSAGARLPSIRRISLEVQITDRPLYEGAPGKQSVVRYLTEAGYELVSTERQSHDQEENLTFERPSI